MNYIYLSGSVAKSEAEKHKNSWRKEFQAVFQKEMAAFPKITKVAFWEFDNIPFDKMPVKETFARDVNMIKESSLIICEASTKVGIGTAQELFIARYYKHPVIIVCPMHSPYRRKLTLKNGKTIDYLHPFIENSADKVVTTYEEASQLALKFLDNPNSLTPQSIDFLETRRQEYLDKYLKLDTLEKTIVKNSR